MKLKSHVKLIPFLLIGSFAFFFSCQNPKTTVDSIYYGGTIYTVNPEFEIAEAIAIKDGKFVSVGSQDDILNSYESSHTIDLDGKTVYPGFIDAHTHFFRYGEGLRVVDLVGAKSFDEVLLRVENYAKSHPDEEWILGSGWDQNLWEGQEFPSREELDELISERPVLLTRIDGHAALANQKALSIGGVNASTKMLGGSVIVKNGKTTGVLIDNAIDLVSEKIPQTSEEQARQALLAAQENCFAVGLTSVVDAGLDKKTIQLYEKMHQDSSLKMRIYAMVAPSPENMEYFFDKGPYQNDHLTVRSFKVYGDGALGSRGAALLKPYSDKPDETGFLLSKIEDFENLANQFHEHGFQMNTHCIGDSANRVLLDIYAKVLKGKNDLRWRIEHAQVVNPEDVPKFAEFSIIPSVQPTHATSDMYWAEQRLGPERVKHAYIYKELLDQNDMIALGSDFPVEFINPIYGFHAAVARKDQNNWPDEGFQTENKLTREEALKGMTIWAAYANFEEDLKGSIEPGKLADLVIMENDLMLEKSENLRDLPIWSTIVGGETVYQKAK
ncbi:amidohydrolase [Algoriphagus machipongonensis]|uniref:Amidohydrolase family protein n=1 Tax=Algoriphagus machipongonensis TaxID=388413 RepID=A3I0Z8_9BACT|nr:amidohydrolase family protein [Algoriphagus machipongonensis]